MAALLGSWLQGLHGNIAGCTATGAAWQHWWVHVAGCTATGAAWQQGSLRGSAAVWELQGCRQGMLLLSTAMFPSAPKVAENMESAKQCNPQKQDQKGHRKADFSTKKIVTIAKTDLLLCTFQHLEADGHCLPHLKMQAVVERNLPASCVSHLNLTGVAATARSASHPQELALHIKSMLKP
eukprot:1147329-Pelagomonas_calceolata.AAC.3